MAGSYPAYCGHCGDIYQRTQWIIHGEKIPVWRCASRLGRKKISVDCTARTVYEKELQAAVVQAINRLITQKDEFLPRFKGIIEKTLCSSNAAAIAELDEKLRRLEKELLERANARQNYDDVAEQIDAVRDEKQRLMLEDANNADARRRVDEIEVFLNEQQTEVADYDEDLARKVLERVTVCDDHLTVEFKSDIEINIER